MTTIGATARAIEDATERAMVCVRALGLVTPATAVDGGGGVGDG